MDTRAHAALTDEERDAREAKLPRWARLELQRLRANLERARQQVAERITDETVAWAEPYDTQPRAVGVIGQEIRFTQDLDDRHYIDVSMDENGVVAVHGSDTLQLTPWVTNVVKIELRGVRLGS